MELNPGTFSLLSSMWANSLASTRPTLDLQALVDTKQQTWMMIHLDFGSIQRSPLTSSFQAFLAGVVPLPWHQHRLGPGPGMFEAPTAAQRQAATGALHQRRRVAAFHRGQGADVLRGFVAALEAVATRTAASVVPHGGWWCPMADMAMPC